MTVDCPGFKALPRMPHSCVRCGRVELAHPGSTSATAARNLRDSEFEAQALRWISEGAGLNVSAIVSGRLDWGDETYGDLFNRRGDDGLKEASDEAIDGISWVLLHLQNRQVDGDAREYAMRACRAFAEAYRELAVALHLAAP